MNELKKVKYFHIVVRETQVSTPTGLQPGLDIALYGPTDFLGKTEIMLKTSRTTPKPVSDDHVEAFIEAIKILGPQYPRFFIRRFLKQIEPYRIKNE